MKNFFSIAAAQHSNISECVCSDLQHEDYSVSYAWYATYFIVFWIWISKCKSISASFFGEACLCIFYVLLHYSGNFVETMIITIEIDKSIHTALDMTSECTQYLPMCWQILWLYWCRNFPWGRLYELWDFYTSVKSVFDALVKANSWRIQSIKILSASKYRKSYCKLQFIDAVCMGKWAT